VASRDGQPSASAISALVSALWITYFSMQNATARIDTISMHSPNRRALAHVRGRSTWDRKPPSS